jgi:predicted DNA-binding protein with PD1-like motif
VICCSGQITQKEATPHVTAKIVLADTQGNITGGHLFSKTIIANGEVAIKELIPRRQ